MLLPVAILQFLFTTNAQTPAGFKKGTVTLHTGIILEGYIKEDFKKAASISFIDNTSNNKKKYDAAQLNAATIDTTDYICIKSDFFKTICKGKISFLQKVSNVAGKIIYNGTEPVVLPGTEGKIYDYFSYSNNQLTHINKKNLDGFIQNQFADCAAAKENAQSINGNIAALAYSINIYNTQNN